MNCFRFLKPVSLISLKKTSLVSSVQTVFRRCTSSMTDCHIRQTVDDIAKSAGDDRLYRALELNNGLRVMLVSDPTTDKSSAAMDVYIGHMRDPKDIPGLAHFCEHMLFLGTKKYPEENEYSKFLNQHGGFSNAFTSNEHTNFYFEVAPDYLEGALDRFAQFFLEPLFTASATEREINAVNSENDKNLQNDSWRFYQLDKSLASPDHDYNKFGTGNKFTLETRSKTLGYDVRNELLKFHSKNYSSNLMGLTILGKESLDQLADMVVPLISRVEDKKLEFAEWTTPPFGPEQSQSICYVTPVKDIRNLAIVWSIPDLHPYYKTNPGHYLGHLIGHEGKGSLLSELKTRGWVNTLSGGQQLGARGFMFCIVNVDLTEQGLEHVDDIIMLTYQYIAMLKKEGPKEWIFKECGDLSAMEFRFKDKERPSNYTSSLASVLHDYPPREVLNAHYLQTEYKPELIEMVLEKLTPQNMRVSVVAKKFEGQTTSKEEWYGTEYKLEKIPEDKIKAWASCGLHENLSLPEKNEFIPTNFDLVAREPEVTNALPEHHQVVGSPKGGGGKKQWKKSNQALGIKTTIQEILRQKKKQKTLECFVADYEWAVRCIAGDGSSDEGVQSDSSESEQQRDNDHGNIDTNFDNQGEAATFSDNEDVLSNLCKSQQQPDNDHGNIDTNVDDQGESDTFSDNEDVRSNLCKSQKQCDNDHGNIDTNFDNQGEAATFSDNEDVLSNLCKSQQQPDNDHGNIDTNVDDQGESDTFSDNEDARSNLCESQQERDDDHGNIDTNFDDQGESDTFSDNEDARSNLCESQKQRDNDHGNIDTNFDDQGESDTFSDNEDARSNLCESQKQRDNDHGNIDTNFDDQGESDTFSDNEDARSNLCESQKQRDNDHGNIDTNFDDQGESDTFSDNEDARSNLCESQKQRDNDHGNIDTNFDDQGESDTFSDNEDARSNLCKIQQQPDNDHGNIDTNVDDQGESDTFSDNEDVLSNLCKSQKQRDNDHGNIDTNFDDQGESDTFSDNEDVRSNLCKSQKQRDNDHGNIDTNFDDQGESDTFSDNEDVRSNLSHSQQENVNDHGNIDTNWDDQGKSDPSESQQLFDIPSLQRDINQPGIYIRKLTKSCKSSKAQASVKKVGNNRVYDNYHSCLFCGEMRQHIKLHLETHKHITEVKQLLANENPDIVRIRKLGDHKHNKKVIKHGKGQIILSRRPETDLDITRYGPCIICKEWVLLKNLKRHVTKCSGRRITVSKRHLIIQSQVEAGLISKSPSKLMLKEVFPCMRMDDIGQLAKSDTLIIALGESWLRRSIDNREKRKYYASQHMRLMAKLLIQIRKLDTSSANKELAEYLVPQHFDLIVAAALECCVPFMDDVEELQSPSNGIKIKYDLQRVLTARWAMLVKEDPHSVLAKEVQTCQELMKIEWADKIVKLSRTVLARRSLGMRKELPAPEDILKLTQFITEELKTTALSAENYTKIVKLAQTRLLVYNKRRSGELEAIRLENYAGKTRDIDEMDQSLIDDLTKVELHLLKSQELMQVRGKGNRPVPVLIPADAIKPLDYIASRTARREAGIPESNVYLFPNSGQSHARAYSSLKCLCDQCLLTYPGRITSVSMRKYTATLTQMLNLNPNQIDWVCKHLGHSSDVHKAHYRQMSGLIERVYVTKLLLLQDLNLTKKFKGQSLDEIDISDIVFPDGASIDRDFPDGASIDRNGTDTLLDNVVEDVAQTERDDEPVDRVVFEDSEDDGEDEDEFEDEAPPPKKIQKKVVRQRWDETEMKEIHEYFKLYLDSKITPRSHEVNSAKKKSKSNGGRIWLRTTDKIVKKISAMNHRK